MNLRWLALSSFCSTVSCVGTTGGDQVTFSAVASGPADVSGGQLEFVNDRGWHVVLTHAVLHVGAIYLNQSIPVSGAQVTSCILNGTYVAEVTTRRGHDAHPRACGHGRSKWNVIRLHQRHDHWNEPRRVVVRSRGRHWYLQTTHRVADSDLDRTAKPRKPLSAHRPERPLHQRRSFGREADCGCLHVSRRLERSAEPQRLP